MEARRIDGTRLAAGLMEKLSGDASALPSPPRLVAVHQGDHGASGLYMRSQRQACESLGAVFDVLTLQSEASESEVVSAVRRLNADPAVTGIIVHLPLGPSVNASNVQHAIDAKKDVEGVSYEAMGAFLQGRSPVAPCTALAAMECIRSVKPAIRGLEAVVVGGSGIVGKPIALLLLDARATVTICHVATVDLAMHTRRAEILVVAVGRPGLITADMVRPGAVVIDVGINRVTEGGRTRTVGDVAFDEVLPVASAITPVPGGVGPVTVATLMQNLLRLARARAAE